MFNFESKYLKLLKAIQKSAQGKERFIQVGDAYDYVNFQIENIFAGRFFESLQENPSTITSLLKQKFN